MKTKEFTTNTIKCQNCPLLSDGAYCNFYNKYIYDNTNWDEKENNKPDWCKATKVVVFEETK